MLVWWCLVCCPLGRKWLRPGPSDTGPARHKHNTETDHTQTRTLEYRTVPVVTPPRPRPRSLSSPLPLSFSLDASIFVSLFPVYIPSLLHSFPTLPFSMASSSSSPRSHHPDQHLPIDPKLHEVLEDLSRSVLALSAALRALLTHHQSFYSQSSRPRAWFVGASLFSGRASVSLTIPRKNKFYLIPLPIFSVTGITKTLFENKTQVFPP